MKKETAIICGN